MELSKQQMKQEFESFLERFYRKLLVLQPKVYIITNITKDAVHLQLTWKSISSKEFVTYNCCTSYKSNYIAAMEQMRKMSDYSLRDAELVADSPFVDAFFGIQPSPSKGEVENSPLQ